MQRAPRRTNITPRSPYIVSSWLFTTTAHHLPAHFPSPPLRPPLHRPRSETSRRSRPATVWSASSLSASSSQARTSLSPRGRWRSSADGGPTVGRRDDVCVLFLLFFSVKKSCPPNSAQWPLLMVEHPIALRACRSVQV